MSKAIDTAGPTTPDKPRPQSWTVHWHLVRHAPVDNPDDLAYGGLDLGIDSRNIADRVAFLRANLPSRKADTTVVCSQLRRTRQTMQAVWPDAFADQIELKWGEQCLGSWEGQPRAEIYGPNGPIRAFFEDPEGFRPPPHPGLGLPGENWADISLRVGQALEAPEAQERSQTRIVFTHSGAIRAALGHVLELRAEQAFGFTIETMSLTRIASVHFFDQGKWHRRWRVDGINLGPGNTEVAAS